MPGMNNTELVQLAAVRSLADSGRARSIRRAAGISLLEVANAVGVRPSTISRWESGQRAPRGDAALRYARLLHRLATREVGGTAIAEVQR